MMHAILFFTPELTCPVVGESEEGASIFETDRKINSSAVIQCDKGYT
jgi:hypothetical protein